MQDNEVLVAISPEIYLSRIKALEEELERSRKNSEVLSIQIEYEKSLRKELEQAEESKTKRHRKKREVTPDDNTYCDFKSNGVRKPHAADSIRSYDDFKMIQDYFMDKRDIRDWALWTIGVSLGLRVSDLLSLHFNNFIEEDKTTIRQRILLYEQKTGKLQNCLITDAVKNALSAYIDSIYWGYDYNGFLFPSKKTGGKMYEEYGWKILSDAGKALNLPINIGSHTMRKSFANIAACLDGSTVDMNSITKVQGLLNHSDQKSTLRYLSSYQKMYDKARMSVSDFVLGKSGINEIIVGSQSTIDDIMEKMDSLEALIKKFEGDN